MTPIKRPVAAAGAAVLLALSLSACGGSAPADASVKDYCEAVDGASGNEDLFKAIEDEDWDKFVDVMKEQAEKIEEVGTPEDISDEAREGFELQLEATKDLDADDVEKAFKDQSDPFEAGLSKDEQEKVEAYGEYQAETCADEGDSTSDAPDAPSDVPTDDIDTEVPSDIPTDPAELEELLSDIPTDPAELEELLSDIPTELLSDLPTQ